MERYPPKGRDQPYVYPTSTTPPGTHTQAKISLIGQMIQNNYHGTSHPYLQATLLSGPHQLSTPATTTHRTLPHRMLTPSLTSMTPPLPQTTNAGHPPLPTHPQKQQQSRVIPTSHPPANSTSAHLPPKTPMDYAASPEILMAN